MTDIQEIPFTTIDGQASSLGDLAGNVVLVVNVASKCGLTPQYEALESLYEAKRDEGFTIVGFPANNFMGQEPGTNEEIKTFCSTRYGVEFPIFSKISVKGDDIDPMYAELTSTEKNGPFGGEIKWNFTKFLVGKDGKVIKRFAPNDTPESMKDDIEAALAA